MEAVDPDEVDAGSENRGRPATITHTGAVLGSGAGAGGGGSPEDIDSDSASGSGSHDAPRSTGQPHGGNDASNHGGR